MSGPDSPSADSPGNPEESGNRGVAKIVGVLIAAGIVVGIFLLYRDVLLRGGVDEATEQRLDLTRTALAATENLESVDADAAWNQLFTETPQDASVAMNRAINRLLRVDELASRATNASLDDSEKMAARAQLPDAISAARQAVEDFSTVAERSILPLWFNARIDSHEASLLPGSMTKSLRREVYQRLAEAIRGTPGKDPQSMILGGAFIQVVEQLEDPIDGLPKDLLADAAKTVGMLSAQHPDNLYFALRAARLGIATQDSKAADYVRRASDLTRSIEPSIRRETEPIGVTPQQLVDQITAAIESENWTEAENRMLLWFNVLNSTEIVKTDRRRANPHPLDLLSFDSLRRLSADVVALSPLDAVNSDIVFEAVTPGNTAALRAVASLDMDLDLDPDLVTLDENNQIQLWNNDGDGQFQAISQLDLAIECSGMIAADLFLVDSSNPSRLRSDREAADSESPDYAAAARHDTLLSLLVFGPGGLQLVQVDGRASTADDARLTTVSGETGLESVRGVITAIAGDLEADGDLDLVVSTESDGIRLFVNRGNRTFFELPDALAGFADEDPASDLAIADLDRDLDLDVVTVHPGSGRVGLIENLLHLQFRGRFLDEVGPVQEGDRVAVEDIDGNVSWDLIIGGSEMVEIVYSQTAEAGVWSVDRVERNRHAGSGLNVADFDNDSWMDLLFTRGDQPELCRIGPWGFLSWSGIDVDAGLSESTTADFNRDGSMDVAGIDDGVLVVFLNKTSNSGHYLEVRFKGIDDNVSGRVNHYAIGSVLELRFGPHYRARIVDSPATHFGLDGFGNASSVRAILPNGLTQTVRDPQVDSLLEEEQTLKGSCPYLYAWDGEKFVFKTDCLWAAPLGLQVARGVVAKDRPWEYLKIDGSDIQPRGDHFEFRITEELWEVAYFDEVAVSVVDHPADVEVWTNEKVGPGEIATPTIFAFATKDRRPLRQAQDTAGRDITDLLAEVDRNFVQAFDRRLRQGLCPPHWIDLDFGPLVEGSSQSDDAKVYLVLTGWILPTDTSLNIQIDQNPELGPIEFPSVWVPDSSAADGRASSTDGRASSADGWRKAIPYMGFPGGKTKTIVVDVTEILNRDDPRFRIRTSAQIYWDHAEAVVQTEPAPFREQSLMLRDAEVTRHGFSERVRGDLTHPETYDYQSVSQTPRWPPLRGELTRFGDCTDLVRQWDDAMVVIAAGDEIRLRFDLPDKPCPDGWKRDFVVHSVGWDKDADLNTLAGQSIGPLPYRGMDAYPPSAGGFERSQQVERLNQHHLQRSQSFRSFWYRTEPPTPDVSSGKNRES
jgi:hypothetical protein